jgi:truncated hemoglobin YjbI
MPQSGNAMAYVSPRLFRAAVGSALPLLGELAGPLDESGESTGATDRLLVKLTTDLIAADTGLAFSASNDADGLLIASKLPFPGKYLDDLFVGDLLYDFVADPEMLALLAGDVTMTLGEEELEELIQESQEEMRRAIQGMGLDEETTKELLDGMEKELRKDLGGAGGAVPEIDIEELSLSPEQTTAVVEETLERMKKGVKDAGLDEETTRKMLESMEQAAREEVRRLLEAEAGNEEGKSGE